MDNFPLILAFIVGAPLGILTAFGILIAADEIHRKITRHLDDKKQRKARLAEDERRIKYLEKHPGFQFHVPCSGEIYSPPWNNTNSFI